MTDSNPHDAPPLTLPRAALSAHSEPAHPDSEEALQYGRHRVAQELKTIHPDEPCVTSASSLRSRTQSPTVGLQQRPSRTSTAGDTPESEGENAASQNARRKTKRWYEPVANFWKTHVSIVIEDGDPRDYLGKSLS